MSQFITPLQVLAVSAALLTGCNDKATAAPQAEAAKADAPKPDAPKTDAPKTDAPQPVAPAEKTAEGPAPTGACDVTLTPGAEAPAVKIETGKTYCLGDLRFTEETKLEDVRDELGECTAKANRGATIMQCKGAKLTFAGPGLYIAWIE